MNKFDASQPIYQGTSFVGWDLLGRVVVVRQADGNYFSIGGGVVQKNHNMKQPVTLPFNPVPVYLGIAALTIYYIARKYGK